MKTKIITSTCAVAITATLAFKLMSSPSNDLVKNTSNTPTQIKTAIKTAIKTTIKTTGTPTSPFSKKEDEQELDTSDETIETTDTFESWLKTITAELPQNDNDNTTIINECFNNAVSEAQQYNPDATQKISLQTTQDNDNMTLEIDIYGERTTISYISAMDKEQKTRQFHLTPQLTINMSVPFNDLAFPTTETINPNASLDESARPTDNNDYYHQMAQLGATTDNVISSIQYCLGQ